MDVSILHVDGPLPICISQMETNQRQLKPRWRYIGNLPSLAYPYGLYRKSIPISAMHRDQSLPNSWVAAG